MKVLGRAPTEPCQGPSGTCVSVPCLLYFCCPPWSVTLGMSASIQRTRINALDDPGTMLKVTGSVAVITSNVNEMMRRMARTIGERHRYESVGIYLTGPDGLDVRLAGWEGDFERIEGYPRDSGHVIHQTIDEMGPRSVRDGSSWNTAMPIHEGGPVLGILLAVSREPPGYAGGPSGLGVFGRTDCGGHQRGESAPQVCDSQQQPRIGTDHRADTQQDHNRDVLDGTSSGGLREDSGREDNPMAERLAWLLPHGRLLLFDTRQYVYRLLPMMRGERGLEYVLRHVAREFERLSRVRVELSVSGEGGLPSWPATTRLSTAWRTCSTVEWQRN